MNRTAWIALSWGVVALAAVAAFALGPYAALAVAAVFGVVIVLRTAGSVWSQSGPAPARAQEEEDVEPEGEQSRLIPKRKYMSLLILALMIHLVAVGVLNLTSLNRMLAPDSWAFRYCGVFIAQSWADPSYDATWNDEGRPHSEICPTYKARSFYQHLNGVMEYLIGVEAYTHVILGFMNMILGFCAAWVMSRIARLLYGEVAAQRAFLYIIFFPSLIVWTSINLRESWSFLLFAGAILSAMKLRNRFSIREVAIFAACMAAMPFIRGYFVVLIGLATLLSYVAVRVRQLPAAVVTIAVLLLIVSSLASRFGISAQELDVNALEVANNMHRGLAYGGSAFGADADLSTPTGALLYLPRGLAMFLLAPFPWSVDSWREAAAIPETFVWYALLFSAVRGMIHGIRNRLSDIALPLSLAVVLCLSYGLVEGNAGTAYRHRAHALLIFFVFAAGDAARRRQQAAASESEGFFEKALNENPS